MLRHFIRSHLFFFIVAVALSCHTPAKVQKVETTTYKFSSTANYAEDTAIEMQIKPYQEAVNREMKTVLAYSAEILEKGKPESKLGNLVADVCFEKAVRSYHPEDNDAIDFAFFNNGGLRSSIPMGAVTKGTVFELMPFENELVVLTLQGNAASKIFRYVAEKGGVPVANMRMGIENNLPVDVLIGGNNFDSTKAYKILTSDYLANGGDQCYFLEEATYRENLNIKVRDALLDYFTQMGKAGDTVRVHTNQRIYLQHVK